MCHHKKHDHEQRKIGLKLLYQAVISLNNIEDILADLHGHLIELFEEEEEDEEEDEHEEYDEDEDEDEHEAEYCHCHEEDED